MAIRYAIKNGNWSDPTTWDGGVSLPGPADDVRPNGFRVTIDAGEWIVNKITNSSATSPIIATGGEFIAKDGVIIRADVIESAWPTTGWYLIRFADPTPASIDIYANNISTVSSGNITNQSAILLESTGTINIYSTDIIVGSGAGGGSVIEDTTTANGTINATVTGKIESQRVTGATGGSIFRIKSQSTVNIQASTMGFFHTDSTGGNYRIIEHLGTGVINVNANLIKGGDFTTVRVAVENSSNGRINITGTVQGGTGSPAVRNSSSGIISHTGEVIAGSGAPAIDLGSINQTTLLTGPFFGNPNGSQAVAAQAWRWNLNAQSTYMTVYSTDLLNPDQIFLYTADYLNGSPSPSDVRLGVTFGPVGEFSGTMAVPVPSAVSAGTPVDHVVGTAVITADQLWGYPLEQMTVPGSVGARFRHVITEELLGKYLAAFGAYNTDELPTNP